MKKQIVALATAALVMVSSTTAFASSFGKYQLDADGFVVWENQQVQKANENVMKNIKIDNDGFVINENTQPKLADKSSTPAYKLNADGFVVWENQPAKVMSSNPFPAYHLDSDGFIVWDTPNAVQAEDTAETDVTPVAGK